MALAALLNLSTVGDNQMRICEHGLELLLEIAFFFRVALHFRDILMDNLQIVLIF